MSNNSLELAEKVSSPVEVLEEKGCRNKQGNKINATFQSRRVISESRRRVFFFSQLPTLQCLRGVLQTEGAFTKAGDVLPQFTSVSKKPLGLSCQIPSASQGVSSGVNRAFCMLMLPGSAGL